jgi:hypothetical protein
MAGEGLSAVHGSYFPEVNAVRKSWALLWTIRTKLRSTADEFSLL